LNVMNNRYRWTPGVIAATLAMAACSSNAAPPPPPVATTVTSPTTTTTTKSTTTSTTTTSTTTLDPKTVAGAAARTAWETYRANVNLCQEAYPNCDVDALLVPYLTNPNKDRVVSSYAAFQADAKASGAVFVDVELNIDLFENTEFTNSELTEVILTSCGIRGSREIIPATPTSPEIVIDDERNVKRLWILIVQEPDGVWRLKDETKRSVEFEGVETCPPEN
jgi:ABC-type glycerol-3-phosphate transport system substrate-binding protein